MTSIELDRNIICLRVPAFRGGWVGLGVATWHGEMLPVVGTPGLFDASSTTGNTIGIVVYDHSPAGTAGIFNSVAGGNVLVGQNNGYSGWTKASSTAARRPAAPISPSQSRCAAIMHDTSRETCWPSIPRGTDV
jgi:hypothetical protein